MLLKLQVCFLAVFCVVSHAQTKSNIEINAFERLQQVYLSEEYSAINHQLAFPTVEANLQQRTDETKATKLQALALNNWQKEFDLRFRKVVDEQTQLHPSNALIYQEFKKQVFSIYEKLRLKQINFGKANLALMTAQNQMLIEIDALSKTVNQIAPKSPPATPAPVQSTLSAPILSAPPNPEKKPTLNKVINSVSKSTCDQKQVQLDSLLLEDANWHEVTSSLNQAIEKQSERDEVKQAQVIQSRERVQAIHELTSFREKYCN